MVGFLLTGLVGTWLTSYHSAKAKERETAAAEQRLNYEFGLKTLEDYSDRYFAHWTRAEMLYQAIRRGANDAEIMARKADYDVAYFDLNSRVQTTLFRFRRALGSTDNQANFETVVSRPVKKLNACLNLLVDLRLGAKRSRSVPQQPPSMNPGICETDRLLFHVTVHCGQRTHDELYRVMGSHPSPRRAEREPELTVALKEIRDNHCYFRDPSDYMDPTAFEGTSASKDPKLLKGF